MAAAAVPRSSRRWLPLVDQARTYRRSWLRSDLVAGVVVAALIIPKNLGYAGIAGVPIEHGLYAAAAGAILYALLGSCRQISMGPSSGLAAVAGGAVLATGLTDTPDVASLVAGITLTSGVFFLVLAVFRLGWLSQFLSRAVVTGFLFGAAIDVVIGELPKLTGTDGGGSNLVEELWSWLSSLGDAHLGTVAVSVAALAVVVGLRRSAKQIPAALVLLVGGLLASWALGLQDRGVALVGEIPRGLPRLEVPDLELVLDHAPTVVLAAFALVMIGFSQTAGDARTFAAKHRYRVDLDQESLAQAGANIGAGLFQGMPVSTSLSASSLNDRTGARTGFASLTSGLIVLLALIALAPLFSALPEPVLAVLIIEAVVVGMMDVPEMRRLRRVSRTDFSLALAAMVGTLALGILAGVVIGIVLSLLWLVRVATHPGLTELGREPETGVFRDLEEHPDDERFPGVVLLRVDGSIFFATSDTLLDNVRTILLRPGVRGLVLHLASVNVIDSQGAMTISEIVRLAADADVQLRLAAIRPPVRRLLEREGTLDRLGAEHIHGNIQGAVSAMLRTLPPATTHPHQERAT